MVRYGMRHIRFVKLTTKLSQKKTKTNPLITDDMMAGVMGLLIPDIADQFFPIPIKK